MDLTFCFFERMIGQECDVKDYISKVADGAYKIQMINKDDSQLMFAEIWWSPKKISKDFSLHFDGTLDGIIYKKLEEWESYCYFKTNNDSPIFVGYRYIVKGKEVGHEDWNNKIIFDESGIPPKCCNNDGNIFKGTRFKIKRPKECTQRPPLPD